MPSKCFVPGCRANYNASSKFRVFSFPHNVELKEAWLKAINREDKREPGKFSKICERHFTLEDIVTETSFFNSITQELIQYPLQKHRLQKNAIPSVFPEVQRIRKGKRFQQSSISDEIPDVENYQTTERETDSSHNSAKMRRCSVPGCKSNSDRKYTSVFLFPKSPEIRDLWLKKIGRPLMNVRGDTSVCIQHFEKRFIIEKEEKGGRKRLRLMSGAVPTIFQREDNVSDDLDNSEDNMKSKDTRSVSTSDTSKESDDDEIPGSPSSDQADLTTTTDRPFIAVVKPTDSKSKDVESEDPLTTEEVFEDSSPVKSSPISKPNSASKPISGSRTRNATPSPYKHLPSVSVSLNEEDGITAQKELSKSGKRSLSTSSSIGNSETPKLQPKRRKIEKPAPTVIGKQNDCYCWVCHRENVILSCIACPRAYHIKCAAETGSLNDWVCPECKRHLNEESVDSRSSVLSEISLDKLCRLLRFSLNKMKHRAGVAFLQPVSLEHYPMYLHYVIHPMDFSLLEKNIKQKRYGCTATFLSDVKWILHNSCVFNGSQHPLSTNAKSMVKSCDNDMQEIEVCPDCFMHNIVRNKYWFSELCQKPHPLVWAKLKGFPYWPAKVVRIADGNVDARFFGAHDRAWVPMSQCFHLSKEMPTSSKPKKKGNYETALDELNFHVELLIQKYGRFQYAPYRTVFNPENKHFTIHGINTDLASKDEVHCDTALREVAILNETEAGTSTLKEVTDSKDTEPTKINLDPTKVSPSNIQCLTENKSKNLSEKELESEAGQLSQSKLSPSSKDASHRTKMELALQRIKGYVTNDLDDEKDSAELGAIEKNTEIGVVEKNPDKDDVEKDFEKGFDKDDVEKGSCKLNEKKESPTKRSTLSAPDSKDDDSNDQDDQEDNICLSDLIKARLLPTPLDSPFLEDCTEKETPAILEPAKKNDSFSLKLIETIASCKAKLGISGDLDKSDSDSEEEDEEEEDTEDEEEEESETEDGGKPRKIRRRMASNGESTEEDASDESSSESDDAESVSSNTDIEMAEEQGDSAVGEDAVKASEEAEKTSEDGPLDVAGSDSVPPEASEKEALSKDAESNVSSSNVSVSDVASLQVTFVCGSKPEVENSGNEDAPLTTVDELVSAGGNLKSVDPVIDNLACDDSDKIIPVNKEVAVNPSPAARSRSVSSNALQSSTDDLTDTDLQMDGVEIQITSQTGEKTDTEPATQTPKKDPNELEAMEDDDIYICPPVRPPTPPLICLDDGTETEPEDDAGNSSNKNKSPTSSPHSTKLPPPDEKNSPESTEKYVSILKSAKLIPQNARKSALKRPLRAVTSESSDEEEMEVITRQKVPTSGAIRTFNRSAAANSPLVSNAGAEHQCPVQPSEIISRNSSPAVPKNILFAKTFVNSDNSEKAANAPIAASALAEISELKKKTGYLYNALKLQQYKYMHDKLELRHNMNLITMEMRASLEADKKQAIDNLTKTLEKEKQRCIDEAKKKQWCAFCRHESRYSCCWNTSYCTITCQKRHIAEHRHICTQLKAEPNDVKPSEGKKVIVLNVVPNKDANTAQENGQQTSLTSMPSIQLVSTPNSQSNSTLQYVLASLRPPPSPTVLPQKPTTSKAENSDSAEPNSAGSNTVKKGEPSLEEIYFPSPPTICFEGLDTALPDENVHFDNLLEASEDNGSDNELTIAEESSADEDLVLTDNDEVDNEMVTIGRGVDVKAKYLNKCLIYGKDATKLTRCLVDVIFSDTLLSMCSAFGNKSNVTKMTRAALPFRKVEAIIDYVLKRFPNTTRSDVTLAINMKCKEARVSGQRVQSGRKSKKTMFRRLLAKEQQQDAKEQQSKSVSKQQTKEAKSNPVPEAKKTKPLPTVTLLKKPLPSVVCLQPLATSGATSTSTGATSKPPNILQLRQQILIRPKFSLPATVGPNKVMLSAPTAGSFKARSPTVRSLLNMTQPLASLAAKEKSKLLFPVKIVPKPSPASQKPLVIVGSPSPRPIAPAGPLPVTQASPIAPVTQASPIAPVTQASLIAPVKQPEPVAPVTQESPTAPSDQAIPVKNTFKFNGMVYKC